MRVKKQDKIVVEINVSDDADNRAGAEQSTRTIEMTGHTAIAYRELDAAKHFGVHKSRIDIDAIQRLKQLGIPLRQFHSQIDTSNWHNQNWFALMFPRGVQARIVAGGVA